MTVSSGKSIFRCACIANATVRITPFSYMLIVIKAINICGSTTIVTFFPPSSIMEVFYGDFFYIAVFADLAITISFKPFPSYRETSMILFLSLKYRSCSHR